jgi:hypothetical protein
MKSVLLFKLGKITLGLCIAKMYTTETYTGGKNAFNLGL